MVNVADLIITSLDTITAFSLMGVPRFVLDELQDTTIANTQDKSDVTGKQGRKLSSLKKNKGVTISGTNGLLSAGMMEAQTGGTFANKSSTPVQWRDDLTVTGNAATTEYKAVGTAGAEIDAVYVVTDAGIATSLLEQALAVGAGKFTYNPTTRVLTFADGALPDGTQIVVYYTRNIAGDVLDNDSEKYSEKLRLYVDGTAEDKCGNVYRIQFHIPKADFSGNFDIALGGDQTVHGFEAESLVGACGGNGSLWSYTVFGANADDVPALHSVRYVMTGAIPADNTAVQAVTTNASAGDEVVVRAAATTSATTHNGAAGTFTFGGWQTTDASVSSGKFTMPNTDVTFTGEWTFTPAG